MQQLIEPSVATVVSAYPLSPIQEGMLAHALLEPGAGIDIVQIACRFHEPLDRGLFAEAWRQIIQRHTIFRTRFRWADGGPPRQEVLGEVQFPWTELNWRELPPASHESRFAELLLADRARGFAMDQAPLCRFYLADCGPEDFRFGFSFHHALLDGSSFPPVAIEAFEIYEALRQGREPALAPAVPYRRYVEWLTHRDHRADEGFWRARLAGVRAPTPLPGNPSPPREGTARERYGERERFLSEADSRGLEAYATRHGLTLNTLTQGAWALLLGRHAGQQEVVFGVTRRCRNGSVEGADAIIGPMLNTVPMRVSLPPDRRVTDWLTELRAQWNGLRAVEHTPAPLVHTWSDMPAGTPLFESIAVFETSPLDESMRARGGAWRHRDFWAHHQTNYPITLNAYSGSRLRLRIIYDAQRFQPAAIERLLGHLETLLQGMLADEATPLGRLAILPDAERVQLLREWNDTAVPYAIESTVTSLLNAQAARTPEAVAVRAEETEVTFAELHRRADQLAHHLRGLGIGPNVLVAVCAERSIEMVVALLAVLKADGAYVPLDPDYPADRLAFMIADSAAPVLLTQARLLERIPAHAGVTFCLDRDWPSLAAAPEAPITPSGGPGDLAYMIYTSGSTGRPKGALNTHRGIVNRLLWMQDRFQLTASDSVLQKTPFSFDVSVWEFLWPLLTGARLVMARPGGHRDTGYLCRVIQQERVTVLHFVPSMLRAFLADPGCTRCTTLRDVMCSGEALPPDLADLFFERLPARLHNLYGPTEAAVDVTCWSCEPGSARGAIPIGKPIANTRTYILDTLLEPVPIGAAGELYLGGVQVGLGYRNRPDLTAERFIPDRFSDRPTDRLYRTGDLARYLDDGNIEFLGRLDDQVKIRGFRIELGEIETVLAQLRGVGAAAVAVHQGRPGEQRLVAYYVPEAGAAVDPLELRAGLAAQLPEHMVPSALLAVEALPLSPNGKLDRKALPAPDADQGAGNVAPRTEAEEILARIWADLLKRETVGVTDNFFDLGGDSILSIYIAVRARQAGIELLPRDILQHQTIEAVARIGGTGKRAHREQSRIAGPAPLTPVQRWFFEQPLIEPSHWNQGFLFTAPADLDASALAEALAAVADHHDALRLRFSRTGNAWTQEHDPAAAAPSLDVVELAGVSPSERPDAIEAAASALHSRLNLEHGPVMRAALFRVPGEPARLLVVAHHLVVDGVSWQILMQDLDTAYAACSVKEPPVLPAKTSSFSHWAHGLEAYAAGPDPAAELPYWKGLAMGGWPALPPPSGAGGANLEGSVRVHTEVLDAGDTEALLREVPAAYAVQMNDILLTALAGALSEWSGAPQVALDLEGHGREDVIADGDFSRTVGWFTSVFPVRLHHDGGLSAGRQLLAVKESLRAVPRHGIGYGVLRYLTGVPELGGPDPEISFNYLGQFDQVLAGSRRFGFAPESAGAWRGGRNPRRYRFDLNALIVNQRLEVRWSWHPGLDRPETVARVAADMIARLRGLIAECRSPNAGGRSPSDFPLAGLTQESLDALVGSSRDIADLYPLTPMQLLFYTEAAAGADPGFEQWEYRLRGAVASGALRRAWDTTIARHPALRSSVVTAPDGAPLQMVRRQVAGAWTDYDWRGLGAAEQAERLERLKQEDRQAGFALERAPLSRLALIRVADSEFILLWSHHHLMIDRLSWPVILREVGALYQSYTGGPTPHLPAAPPYQDYLTWLQARNLEQAERFWRDELGGTGAPVALGTGGFTGEAAVAEVTRTLDPELTGRIARIARSHRLTLNTLIQGIWGLWLSRYAGTSDVVFGLAVSGRPEDLAGVDQIVGLFINNIPVRLTVDQHLAAGAWLSRLQARQNERQHYEFTPLSRIYDWTAAPAQGRLFESLVVFQNEAGGTTGQDQWLGPSIETAMAPVATRTMYPLTLLVQAGATLELRLVSRSASWPADAAASILAQLVTLILGLAEAPMRPVSDLLALLPPADPAATRPQGRSQRVRRESDAGYVGPVTAVERHVAAVWGELLGLEAIGRHDNLFELGVHSLLVSRFVTRIREDLQVELPLRLLFDGPTVAALGEAIVARESVPGRTERVAGILQRLAGLSDEQLVAVASGAGGAHVDG